jgi:hypothetical protein
MIPKGVFDAKPDMVQTNAQTNKHMEVISRSFLHCDAFPRTASIYPQPAILILKGIEALAGCVQDIFPG